MFSIVTSIYFHAIHVYVHSNSQVSLFYSSITFLIVFNYFINIMFSIIIRVLVIVDFMLVSMSCE